MKAVVVALVLVACGGAAPPPVQAQRSVVTTRYRKGDYVTYRYAGLFTPEPVELRERVVAQDGNRLTLDITATRGTQQLHWEQIVTDTPDNQRNNVVDALYEYVGGARR